MMNAVIIPTAFGLLVASVLLLTWASKDHVHQKLGLLLLAAWSISNVAVSYLGFEKAPLVIPSLDAVVAILVALVGVRNRSPQALVVFILYALVGAVHVAAFIAHKQATYGYYATLNVLFFLQLLTVGASSAWLAIRHRSVRGRERLRPDPSRG